MVSSCSSYFFLFFIFLLLFPFHISRCECRFPPIKFQQHKFQRDFMINDQYRSFNFLYRRSPVPPSGPSQRHNSILNSIPSP
ncbi:hypothetical protein KFK09_003388 [Dendrobium nobile]|uniref:Secreted protein n=1 Tax=Dendrobium nobile TaxID=94219 RepID=A0A8T3C039_DENNO|nr:hypothetical protein KFK09_003388 [Dendrobium nobile]